MKKAADFIAEKITTHFVFCSIFTVVFYTIFCTFLMQSDGGFYYLDTDCYTRYLRMVDWLGGDFSWYEKTFPFTNCPKGETLHFTRINDIIWLIFSLPFMLFVPPEKALFAGGLIFSPIIFAFSLALVIGTIKKIEKSEDFEKSAVFVFLFCFIFLARTLVFEFGRPDHHSLMLLIAAYLIYNLLNLSKRGLFLSGIAASFGIWASSAPEGFLLAYSVLTALAIGEIFYNHDFEYAEKYTLGLLSGTVFAYVLNPPFEGYFYFDNARLSIIHVVVCAFTFSAFYICRKTNPRGKLKRMSYLFAAAVVSVIFSVCVFGTDAVFARIVDEKIAKNFIPYISEMSPLLAQECGYLLFGMVEILWLCRGAKHKSFRDTSLYFMFLFYLPFAAMMRRFLPYEILFYALINGIFLTELFSRFDEGKYYRAAAFWCIVLNLAFLTSFSYQISQPRETYPKLKGCALTDIFSAPRLIYETGINTVGSPYHRNIEGISNTIEIFSETKEDVVLQKLKKHNIRYVIIPIKPLKYLENTEDYSFYKNLLANKEYKWLKKIGKNDGSYIFYELTD